MKTGIVYTLMAMLMSITMSGQTTSAFRFSGQASAWANINQNNAHSVWTGARYIPEVGYRIELPREKMIDFEVSANLNGSAAFDLSEAPVADGNLKPYRAWIRYSGNQFEVRSGLQKINFGSAAMLRPLMWFDQMDPRDPLQLTDGVWGILGKYYFLNNANLWLWGLMGNEGPKTWEVGQTTQWSPEFGGRIQLPVWRGEAALSAHHRQVDTRPFALFMPVDDKMPESRLGLDAKWDLEVGFWLEASLISKHRDFGMLTHQHMLTVGLDYTFGIGNGLNTMVENLWFAPGSQLFEWTEPISFYALSVAYPISMFANISAMVYYDWKNSQTYNFINFKQDYRKITFYLMGFWNPDTFQLPQQSGSGNLFAGRGFQVMLVYNH